MPRTRRKESTVPSRKRKRTESDEQEDGLSNGRRNTMDENEVACILDDRKVKRKQQFKVRWKEYPEKDDTWEDAKNLDCQVFITSYLEAKNKNLLEMKKQKTTSESEPPSSHTEKPVDAKETAPVKLRERKQEKSTAAEGKPKEEKNIGAIETVKLRGKEKQKSVSRPESKANKAEAATKERASKRQKSTSKMEMKHGLETASTEKTETKSTSDSSQHAEDTSELNRSVIAYDQAVIEFQREEFPDSFYKHTAEERKMMREGPPPDKCDGNKTNEKEETETVSKTYKNAIIRIIFPDQIVIQCAFKPTDKVAALHDFVKEKLNEDMNFYLFTTPPQVILDTEKTLSEVDCVPRARVYLGTDDPLPIGVPYVKQEVLNRLSSAEAATEVACELSKPEPSSSSKAEPSSSTEPSSSEKSEPSSSEKPEPSSSSIPEPSSSSIPEPSSSNE